MQTRLAATLTGAIVCLGLTACTREIHERDLFQPTRVEPGLWQSPPRIHGTHVEPLALKVGDVVLRGWEYQPTTPDAAVLYFYGSGESVARIAQRLGRLARYLNARVLAMDYRGYAFSDGRADLDRIAADALVLYEAWLEPQQRSKLPGLVYGRSLGSAFAVTVAARCDVDGVILEAPLARSTDIIPAIRDGMPVWMRALYRIEPSPQMVARDPQPIDLMPHVIAPLLIIHGLEDRIAPPRGGEDMLRASGSTTRRFLPIADAGHNTLDPFGDKGLAAMNELLVMSRRFASARQGDAPGLAAEAPAEGPPAVTAPEAAATPVETTVVAPVAAPAAVTVDATPEPVDLPAVELQPVAIDAVLPTADGDGPPPSAETAEPADPPVIEPQPVAAEVAAPPSSDAVAAASPVTETTQAEPSPPETPAELVGPPSPPGWPDIAPPPVPEPETAKTVPPAPAETQAAPREGVWIRGPGWQRLVDQRRQRGQDAPQK
jgi:pimeloyl-ACP methyl ester carboxylesterase